jgi:predicted O-methyltransferase YrrM
MSQKNDFRGISMSNSQLYSTEQEKVLDIIARKSASQLCTFLEIGSWHGDSTVILGRIAKENNGILYCIDWWKGNIGTDLEKEAKNTDVFSYFWERINRENLEDVVIPIRARSEIIGSMLKEKMADLVFIDGDHRYNNILSDIKKYAPLVRENGILCGHDCEGMISDFTREFLEKGKDVDIYEGVHCGVVLAVGESFPKCSIDHSIWSMQRTSGGWTPAKMKSTGIPQHRQASVPPLGCTRKFQCYRYGKMVYAVPNSNKDLDLRLPEARAEKSVVSAPSVEELEKKLGEKIVDPPILIGMHKVYNIIRFRGKIYAVLQLLGSLNLIDLPDWKLFRYRRRGAIIIEDEVEETKTRIDGAQYEHMGMELKKRDKMIEDLESRIRRDSETIKEFREKEALILEENRNRQVQLVGSAGEYNIIRAGDRFMAFDRRLGPREPLKERLGEKELHPFILVGDNLDEISERAKKVSLEIAAGKRRESGCERELHDKSVELSSLAERFREHEIESEKRIEELRESLNQALRDIHDSDEHISRLEADLNGRNSRIEELTRELSGMESRAGSLDSALREAREKVDAVSVELRNAEMNNSRIEGELNEKNTRIEELGRVLSRSENRVKTLETALGEKKQTIEELTLDIDHRQKEIVLLQSELGELKQTFWYRFAKVVKRKP